MPLETTTFASIVTVLADDWHSNNSVLRGLILPFSVAGFGALFGAMTAARISRRHEAIRAQQEELEATYAAAIIAASICNSALGLKRQHIRELHASFHSERRRMQNIIDAQTTQKKFDPRFDLQKISSYSMGEGELIAYLSKVKQRSSIDVLQAAAIIGAAENVTALIAARNAWIDDFRQKTESLSSLELFQLYFGLENNGSIRDTTYTDYIDGISHAVDDTIFHSHALYKRLFAACLEKRRGIRTSRRLLYKLEPLNFEEAREDKLFPDPDSYLDWSSEPRSVKKPWYMSQKKFDSEFLKNL